MKKTYFLAILMLCYAFTISCGQSDNHKEETKVQVPQNQRPNIVFVLADDWSYPHASIYGDHTVKTPNFDWLAEHGILFDNAYVAAPSCTASRAAILTGRYPHSLGEGANLWSTLSSSYPNYATLLQQAGYEVVFKQKGWGPGNYKAGGYSQNPAGRSIEDFENFIEKHPKDKPFFLWYGSIDPHRPYESRLGAEAGLSINDEDLPTFYPSDSEIKNDILDYYYEVQRLDYDLSRILFRLKRRKMLENTLIIVTSDNGMPFPRAKANCYDLGTRVPLAIYWQDIPKKGMRSDSFVSLIDLAPTFLEIAGLPVPDAMHGKTILPMLKGENFKLREKVYVERERHANSREMNLSYGIRGIRDSSFLFLHNLNPKRWPAGVPDKSISSYGFRDIDGGPTKEILVSKKDSGLVYERFFELSTAKRPSYELYNVKTDPYQTHNLAALPEYQKQVEAYKKDMEQWRKNTEDPSLNEPGFFDSFVYYGKHNP